MDNCSNLQQSGTTPSELDEQIEMQKPRSITMTMNKEHGNRTSLSATIGGVKDFINSYSYDALSRLDEIDQQGQTGGNAVAEKSVYYGLDAIGDVTAIDRANTVDAGPQQNGPAYSVLSYSATTGQLTGINHEYMGSSLDNLTYTYDGVGRVSTFTSIDGTATYGYDPMSHLTSATYTTATGGHQPANESYSFDTNGNRTANGSTATTPGTGNLVASDGTFDFVYDGNGNVVSRTRISDAPANDHLTTYTWDTGNRLTDVEMFDNSGTLTEHVSYSYDVFSHLIERTDDVIGGSTTTVHYVWDAPVPSGNGQGQGGIVLVFNGDASLTNRYLNGPNTSAYDQYYTTQAEEDVTMPTQQGTVTWDLLDNQGSVRDVANSSGTLVNHINYNSNGVTAYEQDPSVGHLLGWQGGITDSVTGEEDFGLRWYNLTDAVWSQPDPIGFLGGVANLTESRLNDPISYADPSGLAPKPWNLKPNWASATGSVVMTSQEIVLNFGCISKSELQKIEDRVWALLKSFSEFNGDSRNPNLATVRLIRPDAAATASSPGLKGALYAGFTTANPLIASMQSAVSGDGPGGEVYVRLFIDEEARKITAVTLGNHMIVGVRQWQVRAYEAGSGSNGISSGDAVLRMQTTAWEQRNGFLTDQGFKAVGKSDMLKVWKNYLNGITRRALSRCPAVATSRYVEYPVRELPGGSPNPLSGEIPNKAFRQQQ